MTNKAACNKIRKMLSSQFKKAFGGDLEDNLRQRNQELWLVGIDPKKNIFVDICGTISPKDLADINSKGFSNTDAGYRVDAQNSLGLGGKKVDIFLINTDHYGAIDGLIEPIVVHELSHLLEQVGQTPQPQYNDVANAQAILKSLYPHVLNPNFRHNLQWALHLAIGARTIISKRLTTHGSIRAYLEVTVHVPGFRRGSLLI